MSSASTVDLHESQQGYTITTIIGVTFLAGVSVALRLLARWDSKVPFGVDDWLIISSFGLLLVVVGFCMGMVHFGMGLHAATLEVNNIVLIAKFLMVAEILYVVNLVLTKLSLLAMYYRIFPIRSFEVWAYAIGAFIISWVITIIFVFIFICTPVKKQWYPSVPGHCVNQVGTWCANAAATIFSDIAILVLPIPHIWKLNMNLVQRTSLIVIFGLGFFVVFASTYRFTVLFQYSSADPSWTLARVVVWTIIEVAVGILSANLPTLRPILRVFTSRFGSTRNSSNSKPNANASGSRGLSRLSLRSGNHESGLDRPFQRLDGCSGVLVPDNDGKVTTGVATSNRSVDGVGGGNSDGEEIPLQKVMVRTDTKWGGSEKNTSKA